MRQFRTIVFVLVVVAAALLAVGTTACGGTSSTDVTPPSTTAPYVQTDAPSASGAIDWSEASSHMGETVTVEGPVVGTMYADTSNGEPTFLNVGADYPDSSRFTVVIWGEDRSNFDGPPEDAYSGQTIRVTGTISDYQGVSQMEISSPSDIEILQ
jgi:DNA/RNA endonuclease YhcR with UshA esterase domain